MRVRGVRSGGKRLGSARRERWGAPAATNAAVRGVLAGAGAQQKRIVQRERDLRCAKRVFVCTQRLHQREEREILKRARECFKLYLVNDYIN